MPPSHAASHDDHENSNAWFSQFLSSHGSYGAPLCGPSGRCRAPLLGLGLFLKIPVEIYCLELPSMKQRTEFMSSHLKRYCKNLASRDWNKY